MQKTSSVTSQNNSITNNYLKRYLTLVIKETEIKNTMRYIPTRIAKIQNIDSCVRKGV